MSNTLCQVTTVDRHHRCGISGIWLASALPMLLLCGCNRLVTDYGHRRGAEATASVNGTSVLGELFEGAGHEVSSWRWLSPKLDEADVIVWIPDRVAPPSQEVQWWLEDWLAESPQRTLVYVGRDYDAGILYWEREMAAAPAEQQGLISRQLRDLRWDFDQRRAGVLGVDEEGDWFTVDELSEGRYAEKLHGDAAWTAGVNLQQAEIWLNSVLSVDADYDPEVLLADGDEAFVTRCVMPNDSQIIFVDNGSFLLNYGLVNHAHRRLAAKLIDAVGTERRVIFLESGPEDPEILDEDPAIDLPIGLSALSVWPFNVILLHLAAAGIAFCYYRWPILGLAEEPVDQHTGDFGRHITAVGRWLAATRDPAFARGRLEKYRATIPGEAHKSASPLSHESSQSSQRAADAHPLDRDDAEVHPNHERNPDDHRGTTTA
ncbi:MAG: hypothetical protein R3C10_05230 [Pirellulales bacterium]|nr:hypothetical protein [Planctomycetales bacterium]